MRKERKKATKHDAAHRLASMLHVEGRDGVEAEHEASEAFHDAWMLQSRDMLARAEFRRRKLVQRLQVIFQPARPCRALVTLHKCNTQSA